MTESSEQPRFTLIKNNPYPYAAYWNENNDIKIEVWRDSDGAAYAKRVK